MNNEIMARNERRVKRVLRVRKHLRGSAERPRLSVHKSNKHLSVQLIDDDARKTIASAGTLDKTMKGTSLNRKSKEAAKQIGSKIAELAKQHQVERVLFDRGRLKFHGVIAELAHAARAGGLQF
jgi:large subunit ribosomal protein L18